jgi:hypothetical protein
MSGEFGVIVVCSGRFGEEAETNLCRSARVRSEEQWLSKDGSIGGDALTD